MKRPVQGGKAKSSGTISSNAASHPANKKECKRTAAVDSKFCVLYQERKGKGGKRGREEEKRGPKGVNQGLRYWAEKETANI